MCDCRQCFLAWFVFFIVTQCMCVVCVRYLEQGVFLVDVVVMSVRMRLELRCVCPQCKLVMFMERHACMIRL